ncbi:MAG: hemolysin III family protein [Hyphomicrobiaceae bacterium]
MSIAIPHYTFGEKLADGLIHAIGVTASLIGAVVLLALAAGRQPPHALVSLSVYCTGLVAVFAISAAYHLVSDPRYKAPLRRLDHAAIFVKIAATYTPFAVVRMTGWEGTALLALVWSVAAFGLVLKLFFPTRLVATSYVLYLAQGWAVLLAINPLLAAVSTWTLALLGIGGMFYTVGVIFHLWRRLRYHNAIWHGFVVCGSSCHYVAVLQAAAIV